MCSFLLQLFVNKFPDFFRSKKAKSSFCFITYDTISAARTAVDQKHFFKNQQMPTGLEALKSQKKAEKETPFEALIEMYNSEEKKRNQEDKKEEKKDTEEKKKD